MKTRRAHSFIAVFWLLAALFSTQWAQAGGVEWQAVSVAEALGRAGEEGTLVLIDVYATWCGPCQRQDAEVFPSDVVGTAASDLIAVKVDAEAGEGPEVVARYHVVGYPTVLVLRPDGSELDRIFGFMPAEEFAATLDGYRQGRGTIEELRRRVEAEPDNLELAFELGFRATVRGEYEEATALMDRVISGDAGNALGLRARAHLVLGKYMYLRGSVDFAAALEQFAVLGERFPDAEEAQEALFQSAIAHARRGDAEAAAEVIDSVLAQAGEDVDTYNAVAWACYREHFQLERGVEIARRGLEIDPTAHSLWDTLAELQNALGDAAGALESIQRARRLAPDEAYYQRQLERFSALAGGVTAEEAAGGQ